MEQPDQADPGLIVHVFATAKGPGAREHERRLRGIWDVLGSGCTCPRGRPDRGVESIYEARMQ